MAKKKTPLTSFEVQKQIDKKYPDEKVACPVCGSPHADLRTIMYQIAMLNEEIHGVLKSKRLDSEIISSLQQAISNRNFEYLEEYINNKISRNISNTSIDYSRWH